MTDAIQRKLAAILAADVAGYSRLMGVDETGTFTALGELRRIVDGIIEQRGGRIANTAGDSILAEFPSVVEAVQSAIEIQKALTVWSADQSPENKMHLRIGVHIGDVIVKGDDILGDGVNVAARLQTLAAPGAVLVSRAVRDHLRDKAPLAFDDQGEHTVKNIARPVRAFQVRFNAPATGLQNASIEATATSAKEADPTELVFWDSMKESEDTADYRAYLESYPDGSFTALALSRIEGLNDAPQSDETEPKEADQTELAFWNSVEDSKDAVDYEAYIERYPDGSFAALAQTRIDSLNNASPPATPDDVKLELSYWDSVKDSADPTLVQAYLKKYPSGHFRELAEAMLKSHERGDDKTRPID